MIMLDLFITLKVHDEVWADESELHLGQTEVFRDLFDLLKPRARRSARLEDLLCAYLAPLRLDLIAYSVTFAPMRVGMVGHSRRTIVDDKWAKDEKLGGGGAAKLLARSGQEARR